MSPERIALAFEGQLFTYRELDSLSNTVANGLSELGVKAGDRVAIVLPNTVEWIIAVYAVSKLGAAAVLISTAWRQAEMEHALELTNPAAVISDDASAELIGTRTECPVRVCTDPRPSWTHWQAMLDTAPTRSPNCHISGDSELALPFSSGTTGLPKAVRHSHRSIGAAVGQWQSALNLDAADALQIYTPLAHILGVVNLGAAIASRSFIRLFRRFDVDEVLCSIETDRITIGVAVAPVARALADAKDLESRDLSSLRYFNWSATPLDLDTAERFTRRTGVRWMQGYGTTEVPILFTNPAKYPERWRLDSPGLTVSDVEARIIDPQTVTELGSGQVGELVVRSPAAMLGYLPESANDSAFTEDGWYRTGDLAAIDPEGWLRITDRLKEIIKVSGFQVAPAELESVLLAHPAVADCAVFGVDDPARGQVPHAAVVVRDRHTLTEAEVLEWMTPQLASYKALKSVHLVEMIPRTASGKKLRRRLTSEFSPRSSH